MKNMKSNFIYTFPNKDSNSFNERMFRGNYKISIYIQDTLHKKKILKLIKSDSELHKLISNNFDKVLVKLNQTSILEDMRKNL